MMQFSVYALLLSQHLAKKHTFATSKVHIQPEGSVRVIYITRAQWQRSFIIHGSPAKKKTGNRMVRLPV